MATITVTCPTCDSRLELDAVHRGQEVECGSCHQVFIAKVARPERDDGDEEWDRDRDRDKDRGRRRSSSRRRSRRYEDEDDDFDDDYYERRRREAGEGTGLGDASLVLGVIGIFGLCCPVIGVPLTIVGVVLGAMGLRSNRNGTAIAGLILNILFLLGALVVLAMMGLR
ncbi:DUF4190 domain-containing protein [Limnoglobus roseus]|uniref:DUF4190 domain-containing protein n=1 Tax=Limnoglobus roseus TaxID=2598579 RepID=A0A5C1AEX3_9BACT|nr:DUF4190 domain-containing protein [Limnoglobus roseus]QEL16506.1 hypothetical protein PX52LOC_03465 [Limnoglobus roseus]